MALTLTETEKDLVLLGVIGITRTDVSGNVTTLSFNYYGDNCLRVSVMRERLINGGVLDLKVLFDNNRELLQSNYLNLYTWLTTATPQPQNIQSSTNYSVL
jgi:hypothetical protein